MAVNDFVSLLLGEAGGKNAAERYNDMLHIASVVVNRSLATGLPVEDIIANSNEFNAWGKAIPAGNEQYRSIAQQAIEQVMQYGPVTQATFYATPKKTENLPPRLEAATKTGSHEYFTDPENRAIGTSRGYAQVQPVSVQTVPPLPLSAPSPYRATDMRMMAFEPQYADLVPPTVAGQRELTPGAGLANLAPGGLKFDLAGRGRSEIPSSGIHNKVADAARAVDPGLTTVLYSGQEPDPNDPVGTPYRHPLGFAGDFRFEQNGKVVDDPGLLKDVALEMAARHNANIGIGPGYMGPSNMHIDTMPLGQYPGGPQWGSMGKSWKGELEFARQAGTTLPGFGARRSEPIPTPTPRDVGMAMPAVPSLPNFSGGLSPRTAQQTSMAMYGLGLPPSPPPSVPALPYGPETTQAIPAAMTRPGTQGAPMSVPAAPPQTPSIPQSVMDGYRDYGASRALAPASEFPALPAFAPVPAPAPMQLAAPDLPMAAPIPTPAPRNSEAAFLGGILGPATKQIGQNVKTNMQGGRINVFAGIPQAYRDAFRGLGNRFDRMFGGSLPPPTPFSVGRGSAAIQSVMGGGQKPGATAYSNSHPGASWSVNAYGIPEFQSQAGFKGAVPDGF